MSIHKDGIDSTIFYYSDNMNLVKFMRILCTHAGQWVYISTREPVWVHMKPTHIYWQGHTCYVMGGVGPGLNFEYVGHMMM